MVGFEMDARSDRAQLILVGAVAIAIIVLGLAVVFNTVLYTENVASTGAASEPREAELASLEMAANTGRLVERVNRNKRWENDDSDPNDVRDAVLENISRYSSGYAKVVALQSPVSVHVEEGDEDKMNYSAYVADTDGDGDFNTSDDDTRWNVTDSGYDSGVLFRDFEMTVDTDSLESKGDDAFRLMWNESNADSNYTVWIYLNDDGDVNLTTLETDGGDPTDIDTGNECNLDDSGDESSVTIDFSKSTVAGEYSCSELDVRNQIGRGEFSNLQFANADNANGSYSMMIWGDEPDPDTYVSSDLEEPIVGGSESPYWSYAVWELEIVATYESGSTTYNDSYKIEVYNRSR